MVGRAAASANEGALDARRIRRIATIGLGLMLACATALPAGAAEDGVRGLQGLRRVGLEVVLSPAHPLVPMEDVERRMETLISQGRPAPVLDDRSPDRLRLTVSVHEVSSATLRGYYLPFSSSYGVGSVRLAVLRLVTLAGSPLPLPAVVWQVESLARGPWGRSGREVLSLAGELVEDFLDDYRKAVTP